MSDLPADASTGERLLQLWREVRAGDPAANNRLLGAVRAFFQDVLRKHSPGRSFGSWDTSDVVQACCVRLNAIPADEFRGATGPEFESWLRSIVLNEFRDTVRDGQALKRGGGRPHLPIPVGPDGAEKLAGDASTPSQRAMRREEEDRAEAALGRLPPDDQEVIRLWRSPDRLTWARIAERMNRTEAGVKKLFERAFRRWRKEQENNP
jgi:RNA polymerase sigma factor (sigma-70 family)